MNMNERTLKLYDGITETDDSLIEEAQTFQPIKRNSWFRWTALAACLALAVGLGAWWVLSRPGRGPIAGRDIFDPDLDPAIPGGAMEAPDRPAGPLLTLTAVGDTEGVTAERQAVLDFAGYADPLADAAAIRDAYVLTNASGEDRTFTVLYPYTGSFGRAPEVSLTLDGATADTRLLCGPYAGSFQGAGNGTVSMNLFNQATLEDYEALLADGSYLEAALGDAPALSEPVTVYEVTDVPAGRDDALTTLALRLTLDPEKTRVLTYGFNGRLLDRAAGDLTEACWTSDTDRPCLRLIILSGPDAASVTLEGYSDGACTPGNEVDIAAQGAHIQQYESTLGKVLDRAARDMIGRRVGYEDSCYALIAAHPDLYTREARRVIAAYGPWGADPAERYADGRLDEPLLDTVIMERVLYAAADVTLPAGESVTVEVRLRKPASLDRRQSLQTYILSPTLGSGLTFTGNTLEIVNAEGVEFVDPANPYNILDMSPGPVDLGGEAFEMAIKR